MSPRRIAALSALLISAALVAAGSGCSSDDPPSSPGAARFYYRPTLHSVDAPDSAVVGDTLDIVSWIVLDGCKEGERAVVTELQPGYGRIELLASQSLNSGTCDPREWGLAMPVRVPVDVAGVWRFDVVGRTSKSVEVVVVPR